MEINVDSNACINSITTELNLLNDDIWITINEKYVNIKRFLNICHDRFISIDNRIDRYKNLDWPCIEEDKNVANNAFKGFQHVQMSFSRLRNRFKNNTANQIIIGLLSDKLFDQNDRFTKIYTTRIYIRNLSRYIKEYDIPFDGISYLATRKGFPFDIDKFASAAKISADRSKIILTALSTGGEKWVSKWGKLYSVEGNKEELLKEIADAGYIINNDFKYDKKDEI